MASLMEKIEDELSCPVCLEHYDRTDRKPKMFQGCFHTFCQVCVATIQSIDGKKTFPCPLCKAEVVKLAAVTSFTTNFTVMSILERLSDNQQQTQSSSSDSQLSSSGKRCKRHVTKITTHVCIECWKELCIKCVTHLLNTTRHSSHIVVEIEEAWPIIQEHLRRKLAKIAEAVEKTTVYHNTLKQNRTRLQMQLKVQVQNEVEDVICQVKAEEVKLNARIDGALLTAEREEDVICQVKAEQVKLNARIDRALLTAEREEKLAAAQLEYLSVLHSYGSRVLAEKKLHSSIMVLEKCWTYKFFLIVDKDPVIPIIYYKPNSNRIKAPLLGSVHESTTVLSQMMQTGDASAMDKKRLQDFESPGEKKTKSDSD